MPTYTTPGVYIEELPAVGPITGVGTSNAAFIGPASKGPVKVPTKVTNWAQFKATFGDYLAGPPRFYLAYAVEGFFKNGGTVAYIVRVGTAVRAFKDLNATTGGLPTLRVEALEEGPPGNAITVQVAASSVVTAAEVLKATAPFSSAANNAIVLTNPADATRFRPGDVVVASGSAQRLTIDRIKDNQLLLSSNLAAALPAGNVRIADLIPGQKTFRVEKLAGLETGSVIKINNTVAHEDKIVERVQAGFVTLSQGLTNGYGMQAAPADPAVGITSYEFDLIVRLAGIPDENSLKMSMDPRHSHYFGSVVDSKLVTVANSVPPSTVAPPNNMPAVLAATNLTSGTADDPSSLGANHYSDGLDTLKVIQDVNIVCIPDRTDQTVQQALIAHCEAMGDRFAILDSQRGAPPFGAGSVVQQRAAVESARGYAALYYPWLVIADPQSKKDETILVPPSGFMTGLYARVDQQRGVHKAPANEMVTGALSLERFLSETDIGQVNIENINVIRTFPNRTRPTVWGARTTTPAAEAPWRYINVRRLFLFVEQSIKDGIRWSVLEPNDLALWQKLKLTISEFLTRVWKSGALFGATADEAFYVKCDEELNPAPVRALGQVFVEIGIAPVRPAEFVIIRIGIWDEGSKVNES